MSNINYHGFATYEGRERVVFKTVDDEAPVELQGGPFAWGKGTDEDKRDPLRRAALMAGGKNLALALCTDALGRADMGQRVAVRFQHRKVTELATGADFTIRHSDLLQVIGSIVEAGAGNDKIREAVDRERAPVASEGGVVAGVAVSEIEKDGVPVSRLRSEE